MKEEVQGDETGGGDRVVPEGHNISQTKLHSYKIKCMVLTTTHGVLVGPSRA